MNMEQMIKENIKDGRSMDEIAKAFTEAMNRVKNERNKYLNSLEVDFDTVYVSDAVTLTDIAKYAAAIAARTNEKWTKKEIEAYKEAIDDALNTFIDVIDKDPIQILMNMFDDIKSKSKVQVQVQIAQPKDKFNKLMQDSDAAIKFFLDSLDHK